MSNTQNRILIEIFKQKRTVFSLAELSQMFADIEENVLRRMMSYYVKKGELRRLRRGVYAKDQYNRWELANKVFIPSYVSFQTVLEKEGVVFQQDSVVHSASYLTRRVEVDDNGFSYHRLSESILLNDRGVEKQEQINVASKERAFLDCLYLYGDMHFDNLKPLDWERLDDWVEVYENKALKKRLDKQHRIHKEEHVG